MIPEKLDSVNLTPEKQVDKTVDNNPVQRVKDLLGVKKLFIPKKQPGVYGIYFEKDDVVYIGQTQAVSNEITIIKRKSTSQLALNQAMYKNEPYVYAYAVMQGPGCSKKERLELERDLIRKAGKKALNISENPYGKPLSIADNPKVLQPHFIPFNGSWSEFGLQYENIPWPTSGGCIYIVLHKATGNLYIGESSLKTSLPMRRRHKYNIGRLQMFRLNSVHTRAFKSYEPMVKNMESMVDTIGDYALEFYYSAIKDVGPILTLDLVMKERKLRKEAVVDYPERLYNPLGKQEEMLLRNFTLRAAKLIPPRSARKPRTEGLPNLPKTFMYPAIIEGKWYESIKAAARIRNESSDRLRIRVLSPNFPDYIWLRDQSGKSLPEDCDIKAKEKEFQRRLEAALVYFLPETPKQNRGFMVWYKKNWYRFNND